jgi:EmrB/QacA subfamily drug resistance transporter
MLTSAATFVFVMDSGLLSIAFPKLAVAFKGTNRATLSWASTGFSVVMAACMAFAGSVADRFGRKRVYLFGLAAYTAGATVTAIAPNVAVLIGARLMQGAGAAFFVTAGLALALVAFPPARRATALGLWGIIGSAAAIVSPTVGAAALDTWSWRWAFGGLAACSGLALIAGFRLAGDGPSIVGEGPPDPLAVVLGAVGVALIVLSISRSQLWGWIDPRTLGALVIGLLLLPVVVRRSFHHPRPLVPPALARHREYLLLTASCVVQQVGFFGYFFSLPLILTGVWKWSSLSAGYAMAGSMAVSALVVFPCARWAERRGYTGMVLAGTVLVSVSYIWWLITFSTSPNIGWALVPGLVITGVGSSITGNFASGSALHHVPPEVMGQGNSLHQMSRRIGGSIGVALTIALIGESHDPKALLAGAHRVWILLIVVHGLMAVLFALGSAPSRSARRPIPSG